MTTAVTVTAQTLPEEAFATLVSLPTTTNISRSYKNASQILSRIVTIGEGSQVREEETKVNFQIEAAKATIAPWCFRS